MHGTKSWKTNVYKFETLKESSRANCLDVIDPKSTAKIPLAPTAMIKVDIYKTKIIQYNVNAYENLGRRA